MHRRTLRHIAFMLFALCAATSLFGLGTDVRAQASRQKKAPATKAETFVLNQFKAGRKADFTDSSLWTPEEPRVIGADFLKRLLTNSVEGLKSGPKGVFIKGAVVEGYLELSNVEIPYSVSLIGCTFKDTVEFNHVSIKGDLNISGDFRTFDTYEQRRDEGQAGSVFEKQLMFVNVSIDGDIYANNCHFNWHPSAADCPEPTSTCDAVDFEEAKVANDAFFNGAIFQGPVNFDGAHFAQVLIAEKAEFQGPVSFVDVRVKDDLDLDGSHFGVGADFSRAEIDNLFGIERVSFDNHDAGVNLQDMEVGKLQLSDDTNLPSKVSIGGMTYHRLSMEDPHDYERAFMDAPHRNEDERAWDKWLAILDNNEYRVDSYAALESFVAKQGYPSLANDIYIHQRDREAGEVLKRSLRRGAALWCWDLFLKYSVGYGRKPELALIYSLIVIVVGCGAFPRSKMELHKKDEKELKYSRFWYSLDLYLPVVDIHISEMWVPIWPNDSGPVRYRDYPKFALFIILSSVECGLIFLAHFLRIRKKPRPISREYEQVKDKVRWHYMHVHALLGWILIPIGLAAVTGIVK